MTASAAPLKVTVLGAGTVGSQVIRLLDEQSAEFAGRVGAPLQVTHVVVRDVDAPRDVEIDRQLLTTDAESAIADSDLVVELIGGIEPARTFVLSALQQGRSVITGNKALLAAHGPELYAAAAAADTDLYYEAAVAGAIPVVYGLRESLVGDRITKVLGIVNGTTNFILDQMASTGASYEDALAEAQARGFAEADPSADVDGLDAAAKGAILASLAFHTRVSIDDVTVEGISGITADDIAEAKRTGQVIKLLAVAERHADGDEERVSVRVYPTLVPADHPLASVAGAFNAVLVEGEAAGQLMFYGQGAGGAPTASAVLSDLVAAASHRVHGGNAPRESVYAQLQTLPFDATQAEFQLRLEVKDRVGVLAEVATIFANQGVSIASVDQRYDDLTQGETCTLIISTHLTGEGDMAAVLAALEDTDAVERVLSTLRRLS